MEREGEREKERERKIEKETRYQYQKTTPTQTAEKTLFPPHQAKEPVVVSGLDSPLWEKRGVDYPPWDKCDIETTHGKM